MSFEDKPKLVRYRSGNDSISVLHSRDEDFVLKDLEIFKNCNFTMTLIDKDENIHKFAELKLSRRAKDYTIENGLVRGKIHSNDLKLDFVGIVFKKKMKCEPKDRWDKENSKIMVEIGQIKIISANIRHLDQSASRIIKIQNVGFPLKGRTNGVVVNLEDPVSFYPKEMTLEIEGQVAVAVENISENPHPPFSRYLFIFDRPIGLFNNPKLKCGYLETEYDLRNKCQNLLICNACSKDSPVAKRKCYSNSRNGNKNIPLRMRYENEGGSSLKGLSISMSIPEHLQNSGCNYTLQLYKETQNELNSSFCIGQKEFRSLFEGVLKSGMSKLSLDTFHIAKIPNTEDNFGCRVRFQIINDSGTAVYSEYSGIFRFYTKDASDTLDIHNISIQKVTGYYQIILNLEKQIPYYPDEFQLKIDGEVLEQTEKMEHNKKPIFSYYTFKIPIDIIDRGSKFDCSLETPKFGQIFAFTFSKSNNIENRSRKDQNKHSEESSNIPLCFIGPDIMNFTNENENQNFTKSDLENHLIEESVKSQNPSGIPPTNTVVTDEIMEFTNEVEDQNFTKSDLENHLMEESVKSQNPSGISPTNSVVIDEIMEDEGNISVTSKSSGSSDQEDISLYEDSCGCYPDQPGLYVTNMLTKKCRNEFEKLINSKEFPEIYENLKKLK